MFQAQFCPVAVFPFGVCVNVQATCKLTPLHTELTKKDLIVSNSNCNLQPPKQLNCSKVSRLILTVQFTEVQKVIKG